MATPPTGVGQASREPVGQLAVRPFGKYFLVRKLAEGGMAEIFLAKQVGVEGFERNVVIKRMLQHLTSVSDFVAMFLDEARLATRLSHPNIVQINDLGLTDGCYYICMEYLPGEDFSTMLRTSARRRDYVPLHVVAKVVAEAARGLHFAHTFTDAKGQSLNIVHRDISPSNIFVTYTGQVKVLDFGIAKAESRVTQTTAGVVKGKYMYMSPEQARSGEVDCRADVFSLGVSLYEALTNTRPFARDTDLAILNAVLTNEFKPLRELRPEVPSELEAIVVKAMKPNPVDRFQTADEMASALERYLAAGTSASGGAALTTFMVAFFGAERVASKTRIDSLAELASRGVDVPGFQNPTSPRTEADLPRRTAAPEQPTSAVGLPRSVVAQQRGRLGAVLLAVLGGVAVTSVIGFLAWKAYGGPAPLPPAVVEVAPVDAGPPPALVVAAPFDAGAPTPEDGGSKAGPEEPQVVARRLDEKDLLRTVGRSRAQFSKCFKEFEVDLDGAKGSIEVRFEVARSGKVTQATAAAGKRVGPCMEKVARTLRFPPNTNPGLTFTVPFDYSVERAK